MNLSWKQLLVCGTTAAVVGYLGYKYYFAKVLKGQSTEGIIGQNGKHPPHKSQRKSKSRRLKSKTDPRNEKDGLPDGIPEVMGQCELSVVDLLKLPAETKQRVFYALLTKGEFMMNQGAQETPRALEYFSKAVSIVPNPGEVVAAFEKMLPPAIFNALLDKIQRDIQAKVEEYFTMITPTGNKIIFKELDIKEDGVDKMRKSWKPFANKDFQIGEILWEEVADVTSPMIASDGMNHRCEFCLCKVEDWIKCPACNESLYCSEQCREKSSQALHLFFCKPDAIVEETLEELDDLCRENSSSIAILMLRYIATLLGEELRGNGAASNGPFAHYDHLRPVFGAPSEIDRREAKLLRKIFSTTNKEIVECNFISTIHNSILVLSDDIYTSMKTTLARHILAVGSSELSMPLNLSRIVLFWVFVSSTPIL